MQPTFETKSQRYEKKSGHQKAARLFYLLKFVRLRLQLGFTAK